MSLKVKVVTVKQMRIMSSSLGHHFIINITCIDRYVACSELLSMFRISLILFSFFLGCTCTDDVCGD